ncbi:MAG: glycosyl transferase family 2 [Candidatus Omnitrophica bacterium CG11_big_fil_rev_8_21_14_0_20_45_26]|uniref:Glycosyl transferase family 2 n=1 Tax=Candidatus Abzuiibacterium crystallinum TaxID=1974748 RepID=A0A2H0LR60_9BACT|nr:MAG: glycosyl transferase family 2 [Candidatus Omnitrophica bacterium CG11_big_fil_rev_8_21_14_0_20_45_26]PIW64698.1 MAG: glycosyl transferase family 2 [Candidatus Omnitrophica bacterium CG12_big_fil_rev_8_21_14_0_65_45_16]
MNTQKILIIVPALNEEKLIGDLVREIKAAYPYDVLVINDGSLDQTAVYAVQAGAKVVTHPYNLGIGGAVQTGFKFAEKEGYKIVVQVDGDAQHDPRYIQPLIEPVLKGQFDLCIGSRFIKPSDTFKSTFIRRIGIRFFAVLLGWLTGVHVTDPTSGFRATGPALIKPFSTNYPVDFPEPETIKIAKRLGAHVGEVPVQMRQRLSGHSSIRYFRTVYYMIKVTIAILIDALRRNK